MRNLSQNYQDTQIEYRSREMRYFRMLDRNEQAKAIRRLSESGYSDHLIASATALSVGMVRQILGEQRALEEQSA